MLHLERGFFGKGFPGKKVARQRYIGIHEEVERHGESAKPIIEGIMQGESINFEVEDGLPKDWLGTVKKIKGVVDTLDTEGVMEKLIEDTTNPNLVKLMKKNLVENRKRIRNFQNKILKSEIDRLNNKEKEEIEKNLDTRLISNFTGRELPGEIQRYLRNGRKFVPYFGNVGARVEGLMREETTKILNGIMSAQDSKLFNPGALNRDIRMNLSNPNISSEDIGILENILEEMQKAKEEINNQEFAGLDSERKWKEDIKKLITEEKLLLLESDKGLGFSLLTMEQVITLYRGINETQSLILTDLDDEKYLTWVAELKKEHCPTIPKEIRKLLTKGQIENFEKTQGEIAILRLLIKSGKIDSPSPESFRKLTARTVKTGVNDPVNGVSDIIRIVTQHFIKRLKDHTEREYGTSFTVIGCDDAYKRMERSEPQGSLTDTLNMQGDITEMYPNCIFPVVRGAFNRLGQVLKIDPKIMRFVTGGIFILMRANVVREPEGVFQMGKNDIVKMALSIGDPCAAEVSDATLMMYELDMAASLRREKLLQHLKLYLRFRDDIDTKIGGTIEEKFKIIWIILTNFPHCFHLKISISFFISYFLDIKRITNPGGKEKLALLRKKNNCYDVTRATSNTFDNAKSAAMTCYAYRIFRRTNWQKDRKHQEETNILIMEKRGHSKEDFLKILEKVKGRVVKGKRSSTREPQTQEETKTKKRFIPAATWDVTTRNHDRVCGILRKAGVLERYKKPGYKSNKKVLQLVFTKKVFINYLEEFVGRPLTTFKKFKESDRSKDKAKTKVRNR